MRKELENNRPKQDQNPEMKISSPVTPCQVSRVLDGSAYHICWTQCICYSTLFPVLSGRYFTALASPNSCNLNGKPGFIFTTSWLHGFLEHTFWRDCPVKCLLTSASNWTIEGGIYNPPTFNSFYFFNLYSSVMYYHSFPSLHYSQFLLLLPLSQRSTHHLFPMFPKQSS